MTTPAVSQAETLIQICKDRGITMSVTPDNQIKLQHKPGQITHDIAQSIAKNKPELLRLLLITDDVVDWAASTPSNDAQPTRVTCASCRRREPAPSDASYSGCVAGNGYHWGRKPHPCPKYDPTPPTIGSFHASHLAGCRGRP